MPSPRPSVLALACAITVAAVAATSFAMSFQALTQLAAEAGLPLPGGLAIAVDGAALTASLATVVLRRDRRRSVRWYAPGQLILTAAFSTFGNALHATGAHLTTVDAGLIGAVPPLVCVLSAHLLLLLTAPGTTPAPKTRTVVKATREIVKGGPVGSAAPVVVEVGVPVGGKRAAAIAWAREYQADHGGVLPSGPALAEKLELSRKSGSRLRAQLLLEEA